MQLNIYVWNAALMVTAVSEWNEIMIIMIFKYLSIVFVKYLPEYESKTLIFLGL